MSSQIHHQLPPISHHYPDTTITWNRPEPGQGVAGSSKRSRVRRRRNRGAGEGAAMRKRKLSEEQVSMLEQSFGRDHKLESERKDRLALELGLEPRQVAVWFQNRRARWRGMKILEEYNKLSSQHEAAVLENSHLGAQILKLKEKLQEAEKEIQRLSQRVEGVWNNSPSSSMEAMIEPNPFGELGMEGLESMYLVNNGLWSDNFYYV